MIKFNDELKKYKYELDEVYNIVLDNLQGHVVYHEFFELAMDGHLTIKAGYRWDGPSGPTIDTPGTMEASLIHDVGYQAIRMGLLPVQRRKVIDGIFYRMLLKEGVPWWRATYFYLAVRIFGGKHAAPPKPPVS